MLNIGKGREAICLVMRVLKNASGQDSIEYALVFALVVLAAIAAMQPLSKQIAREFSKLSKQIESSQPPPKAEPCDPDKAGFCAVEVFFATDRNPTGEKTPKNYFGGDRNEADNHLTFGTVKVSIPARHETGKLEEPLLSFIRKPDLNRDVVAFDLQVTPSRLNFVSSLSKAINASQNNEALVFIHGYDTTFDDAARRTAQLAWDLQFRGVPILYSWPSAGFKLPYSGDEAAAYWAADDLKQFLEMIATESGARTVHIIAHSMGNRALMYALHDIALQHSADTVKFRQIILAAPDIDAGVFKKLSAAFPSVAGHVTVYASSHDKALALSKIFHFLAPAAGRQPRPQQPFPGTDVIDASVMSDDFLSMNHSYFAGNVLVLEDMGYVIRLGLPPLQRGLLDPFPRSWMPLYWTFRR
jgi:esterase/lipase superfamily enzyme/Flp pilus assembly pilin Flp